MDLLPEYLRATVWSLFGFLGGISTLLWLVEMIRGKPFPKLDPRWLMAFAFVCFSVAQFSVYRNAVVTGKEELARLGREHETNLNRLAGEVKRLNALLNPPIEVHERDSESWFWIGKRYPQGGFPLDGTVPLEMNVNTQQRLNPAVRAPESQSLSNVLVFLHFSRPVQVESCDPKLSWRRAWTDQGGNMYSTRIRETIPRGLMMNGSQAFCFRLTNPGPLLVSRAVISNEFAPAQGRFSIAVNKATP